MSSITPPPVLLYDCRTGVFRESKPLPVVAWDIEALHNGDFILAFSPLTGGTLSESQPNYRLFVTDSDFAVKRRLFAFDAGYSEPLGRPTYFSVSGDSLVFSSFWFDGFTVFDRRDAVGFRHVAIDFARGIPGKYRQDRDAVLDGPYRYPVAVPVLCGDYVAVDVCCGEYLDTYLFDPAADAFIGNSETGAYLFPPVAVFEGRFVALLPGSSYANLVEEGFSARSGCRRTESERGRQPAAVLRYVTAGPGVPHSLRFICVFASPADGASFRFRSSAGVRSRVASVPGAGPE